MSRPIYKCHICSKIFTWTKSSSWYGSYADLELNPSKVRYFCSKKCADKYKTN